MNPGQPPKDKSFSHLSICFHIHSPASAFSTPKGSDYRFFSDYSVPKYDISGFYILAKLMQPLKENTYVAFFTNMSLSMLKVENRNLAKIGKFRGETWIWMSLNVILWYSHYCVQSLFSSASSPFCASDLPLGREVCREHSCVVKASNYQTMTKAPADNSVVTNKGNGPLCPRLLG